jgi:hypothetical protein
LFITSRGHVRVVREWWSNGKSSLSKHVTAPSGNFDPYLPAQPTQNTPQLKSNFNSATIWKRERDDFLQNGSPLHNVF